MKNRKTTVRVDGLDTGSRNKSHLYVVTRNINASLCSGELTCLLGPNGAGKSTLLKTLTAFLPPVSGKIIIDGQPIEHYSDAELAKLIGIVLTEKPSVSNMTAEELIGLGRSPYTGFWGRLTENDKDIVEEAIALTGTEALRNRIVQTLSDGERQKVMIAKALAQETPIIFLDEPTAFLDYPSKVEMMQLLHRLSRERNKTVFLSTHDMELALQIADKIWLLDKPHGVTVGTPEDLALSGDLTKYFQRKGITFDIRSGQFSIDHILRHSITLSGESPATDMVRKALARNGIATTCEPGINCISASPSGYLLNGTAYDNIGELLDAVDYLLNTNPQ